MFVRYLKEVRRKWGRILLVTDNASQHKHREVRWYMKKNNEAEILYLPAAMPELSAVEALERRKVPARHFRTLRNAGSSDACVSEYFMTCSIRLDIHRFLYHGM